MIIIWGYLIIYLKNVKVEGSGLMIRQEDIAKKLNVSRASVSRALNGGKLNERTRKKILDTAKEMGYIQNNAATSLASKKNIVVHAFLITSVVTGYYQEMQRGIKHIQEIRKGYHFEIHSHYIDINQSKDLEKKQLDQFFSVMENQKADGVILSPLSYRNLEIIQKKCRDLNIPLMTLDMPFGNTGGSHVGPSYEEIGKITAGLLANLIRKKGNILVITFDEGYNLNNYRIKGFDKKMRTYDEIEVTKESLSSISYSLYKEIIKEYLSEKKYDAIYATFRVEYVARSLKELNPSHDIVVVGNDLNEEIKSFLMEDLVHFIVYQRPYYQGFVAADNFFNYFYQKAKYKNGIMNTGSDILFKENISTLKRL